MEHEMLCIHILGKNLWRTFHEITTFPGQTGNLYKNCKTAFDCSELLIIAQNCTELLRIVQICSELLRNNYFSGINGAY
jgi:hypothetical protein